MENEKRVHESYGMIGVYHSTGGERALFGSSLLHSETIHIRIKAGQYLRALHEDTYMGGQEFIDVEMSQAQFAELITSPNRGDGVPCTIRCLMGKKMEPCPFESKAELHRQEFEEHQQKIKGQMDELLEFISSAFDAKTLKKSDKEAILSRLTNLKSEITVNSSFQVEQFDHQMEQTVTEAKAEIEAFLAAQGLSAKTLNLPGDTKKSFTIEIVEYYSDSDETTTQVLEGFESEAQALDKAYELRNKEVAELNAGYCDDSEPFECCDEFIPDRSGAIIDCTYGTAFNDDGGYRPVTLYIVKETRNDIKE